MDGIRAVVTVLVTLALTYVVVWSAPTTTAPTPTPGNETCPTNEPMNKTRCPNPVNVNGVLAAEINRTEEGDSCVCAGNTTCITDPVGEGWECRSKAKQAQIDSDNEQFSQDMLLDIPKPAEE